MRRTDRTERRSSCRGATSRTGPKSERATATRSAPGASQLPAKRARQSTRPSRTPVSFTPPHPDMLATARSAIRLAPALRVDAHARARPVRVGYSPIRRRDLTLPTFARASLGDARGRRPISSPVVSSRPGFASASRRRASRRAAAEGDGAGDRDEDSGQSSVAEAETNAADDADSYNVAEEMPDTIPYKSRDSADEDDDDIDIELPSPGANAEAVKPAKGKDRACAFFPCSVPFLPSFCFWCPFSGICLDCTHHVAPSYPPDVLWYI